MSKFALNGPATALGILYAEDFSPDGVAHPAGRMAPKPAPKASSPPPPPGPTQADMDAACIRAVQAAQNAWSESAGERRSEALAAIAAAMAEARAQDMLQAEAVADGIARTALSVLTGLLPHLCRNHGDNEVRAAAARLVPLLARTTRLVIRVHPGLVDTLAADIAAIDDGILANVELRPANLPPGDVRVTWEDGSMSRDTAAICLAMHNTLAQLGLDAGPSSEPVATSARSLALAQ